MAEGEPGLTKAVRSRLMMCMRDGMAVQIKSGCQFPRDSNEGGYDQLDHGKIVRYAKSGKRQSLYLPTCLAAHVGYVGPSLV
jgi:hypothetical protein